jgi:hypothetical protein
MRTYRVRGRVALAALLLAGCGNATPTHTHTLYRNSPLGPSDRIHVATFDSADKGAPRYDRYFPNLPALPAEAFA